MVRPLLGEPDILNSLMQRIVGDQSMQWSQILVIDEESPVFDTDIDMHAIRAAIVCVPERVLLLKRNRASAPNMALKWTQQHIQNTCGTVAMINVCQNLFPLVQVGDILQLHSAVSGQAEIESEEAVDMHFVAVLPWQAQWFEIDGRNDYGARMLQGRSLLECLGCEYAIPSGGMMSAFVLAPIENGPSL